MKKDFKLLDCTFRDGGYYNDWFFEKKMVEETLSVLAKLPVDYVEIGFRKYPDETPLGDNLYTTEDYINTLAIPKDMNLALMCMLRHFDGLSDAKIAQAFVPQKDSKIKLIRVAGAPEDIDQSIRVCNLIKDLGYEVSLNITHLSMFSTEQIKEAFSKLQGSDFAVVCFADTMGNMQPTDLEQLVKNIRPFYKGELGCHMHDNRGFAMENALHALGTDVTWFDATITGMGRGAGNLLLESFLIEIDHKYELNLDFTDLLELKEKYFWPMKDKYGWGYNSYYHLGSVIKAHPFEMQKLLSDKSLTPAQKVAAIKRGDMNR